MSYGSIHETGGSIRRWLCIRDKSNYAVIMQGSHRALTLALEDSHARKPGVGFNEGYALISIPGLKREQIQKAI